MYLTAVIQTIFLNHNPALVQYETEQEKWEDRDDHDHHLQWRS